MTPLLVLNDVTVTLAARPVVASVSASLMAGTLVALVGPNGAGKTSLLRALTGLVPHSGSIRLGGDGLERLAGPARARAVGYLPQGHVAHWPLPVRDIIALGRYPHGARDPSQLAAEDRAAVERAMDITGLQPFADRIVTDLSGGERARVALARVIAAETPVLLADEPTASLDPRYQIEVMQLMRRQADAGRLVIAVTHDLTLAARFADRIMVLADGRLVADGSADTALADAVMARVFQVRSAGLHHEGQRVVLPWSVV